MLFKVYVENNNRIKTEILMGNFTLKCTLFFPIRSNETRLSTKCDELVKSQMTILNQSYFTSRMIMHPRIGKENQSSL